MENSEFNAVVTNFHNPKLETGLNFRELGLDEVLVKMHSCPINPSDKNMSKGVYGNQGNEETCGVGFEGAGEVIKVGDGVDTDIMNKRVAVANLPGTEGYEGTWRQFIHVNKDNVLPYPNDVDYDQMSSSFVNPQTVCYFWYHLKKEGIKSIIQDAACSSLAKMFQRLCKQEGIDVINIVRRDEQVKELKDLGSEYVLNSEKEDFYEELDKLIDQLQPKAFFDCIGGKIASTVFFKMPKYSILYIYGDLSGGEEISFNNRCLMSGSKSIKSLFMADFLRIVLTPDEKKWYLNYVADDIANGGKIFGTKIVKSYKLPQFEEAIEESGKVASEGKVVLKPFG